MTFTHRGQNSQFLLHLLCKRIKRKINKLSKSKLNDSFCELKNSGVCKTLLVAILAWQLPSEQAADRGQEGVLLLSGTGWTEAGGNGQPWQKESPI